MKKLIALVLALVMVLSLVACGGAGNSEGSGDAAAPADNAGDAAPAGDAASGDAIKVAIWDNNQKAGIEEICADWTAISGIPVKVEVIDWGNYWTLLEAGVSGGQMPDVFWMHSNNSQMYMENDVLLKLNDYIDADENTNMDIYYKDVADLFTRSDGNIYALPKDHDTIALLYNKAIFDKYGVAYPTDDWSWNDVYEAAKAITEGSNGEVYGFAMDAANNQDGWFNFVQDYGAQVITDDHKGTQMGTDEAKAGMEMLRQILTVSAPQTTISETGTDSLFASDQVGMILQGSWMINFYYTAEHHDDYAWALIPYGDANGNGQCDEGERQSCYNGLGWAASAATANPDACYSLIAYLCSPEAQKKQAELGVTMAGMPGISDAFASAFSGMDVSAFTRVEEVGKLYIRPYTRNTFVWEEKLKQLLVPAWQACEDPTVMAGCCDQAQALIDDAIANE